MITDNKVSFEEVVSVLGQPYKTYSSYSYWQCPECRDSGNNNLMYCHSENIIKSFCCDSCKKIFGEIMKNRASSNTNNIKNFYRPKQEVKKVKPRSEIKPDWLEYAEKCNLELLEDEKSLNFILKKRGITKTTIEDCMIGIDKTKRNWVFPSYDDYTLVGFEYRPADLSKNGLHKEKGSPSILSQVNVRTEDTQALVILEGFIDAYCFYQNVCRRGQSKYFHVMTPSNGVNTVIGLLKDFDFSPYKKVILYLDSDSHGIEAMGKIKELYDFIDITKMECGCKDFSDHYLKCIKEDLSIIKPLAKDLDITFSIDECKEGHILTLPSFYWRLSDDEQQLYKLKAIEQANQQGYELDFIGYSTLYDPNLLQNRDIGLLPNMKHRRAT